MNAIFIRPENNWTLQYRLVLYITDKKDSESSNNLVVLSNLSICYSWTNVKGSYKNNKSSISRPAWDKGLGLSNWSHSISDVMDYFEYVIKKQNMILNTKCMNSMFIVC